MGADLEKVLITQEQINARLSEMASEIDKDYKGKTPTTKIVLPL